MTDKTITVRVVYEHNGGHFARNKEMSVRLFEEIKRDIDLKRVVSDNTGRIIYVEEAYKTT